MINWKKSPFIRILIPFVLGILLSYDVFLLDIKLLLTVIVALLGTLIFLSKGQKKIKYSYLFGLVLNVILFLVGSFVVRFHSSSESNLEKADYYRCTIIEPVKEKANSFQIIVSMNKSFVDSTWRDSKGKVLMYMEKDSLSSLLSLGDNLLIKSNLNDISPPKNPNQFNYRNYLQNRSIYQQGYLNSEDWLLLSSESNGIYSYANDARQYLLSTLQTNGVTGDQFSIASALILGSKDELDFEMKQSYATAGAMHVLAVSGLHVGIVFLILNTLLSVFDKTRKGRLLKAVVLILCLWIYALLTGLSPSVLRASTMFSFVIVGTALNRKSSIYNTLGASAFFLLLINPNLLFEVGFQLSYIAVLGIVYLQPMIYKKIYTKWWLLDKIWAITAVSIAAQIATLPLTLYYFNQFPVYFILSNLIVIPAATVILCLGILLFLTSPIPPVSEMIGWLLNKFIQGLNFGVKGIEELPNSLIEGVSISVMECLVLYLIILLFIFGLQQRKLKLLNYGLILSVLFVINDLYEDVKLSNTKSIVVYHIDKSQAIDFIDGNQNVLLAKSDFINDKQKQSFNVKSHWAYKDLNNVQYIASDSVQLDTSLMNKKLQLIDTYSLFYDKKMVRVGSTFNLQLLDNKIVVDYILLSDNTKTKLKDLYLMFNFKSIIVDGSNSKWNRNRVVEEAEKLHIPVINTDFGAFYDELF